MKDSPLPAARARRLLLALGSLAAGTSALGSTLTPARLAADGYELVWSDEFERDGAPNAEKWGYETGFVRNRELQWYQRENAWCEGGVLVLEARRESRPNPLHEATSSDWRKSRAMVEYSSACITTRGLHSWRYGRLVVCARLDVRAGLWPAIWTLGVEDRWPANGEIDLMEYYRGMVLANTFWAEAGREAPAGVVVRKPLGEFPGPRWADEFHVWRLDWDAGGIRMYVDEVLLHHTPLVEAQRLGPGHPHPFRQPHYLLLNLAVGGQGGDPKPEQFPARFEVDYVRVYQRIQGASGSSSKAPPIIR